MPLFSRTLGVWLVAVVLLSPLHSTAQEDHKPHPEVKLSGLVPGIHFEYYLIRQFSTELAVRYSPFCFFPAGASGMAKEMTRVHFAFRFYPKKVSLGHWYIGIHSTYSHLFMRSI